MTEQSDQQHWYNDGDVIVEVSDDNVPETRIRLRLHKVMLATRSVFFRTLFQNSCWNQSLRRSDSETDLVEIGQQDLTQFRLFLDRIYENPGRKCDLGVIEQMLIISDRYQCRGLRQTCQTLAEQKPGSIGLLRIAFQYDLGQSL